jgi:transcriptional regulator with XRE-family HTH domain
MNTSHADWKVDSAQALGAAIADFRVRGGLTQAEVAEACGLHRPYLSDLERGDVARQVDRLFRVIRHLGLELHVVEASPSGA